jgi:hypothetical protein
MANDYFHSVLEQSNGHDGPSIYYLKLIEENKGHSPADWAGYKLA